jgi:serine/threonine-protein kinase
VLGAGIVAAALTLAAVAVHDNRQQLYVRRVDALEATPLADTENGNNPFFSPDGQWLGFWSNGSLRKVPTAGNAPPTTIVETLPIFGATWGKGKAS